ncbi:MAG: c-type cytochrome domain-containing protein [Pirellulaceae bacterium]
MNLLTRQLVIPLVALALAAGGARSVYGQIEWEYSPYRIKVWLALDSAVELTPALRAEIKRQLETWSESWHGAVWTLEADDAPAELATDLVLDPALVDVPRIEQIDAEVFRADKLMLAAVAVERDGYRLHVQELDCRTRVWGSSSEYETPHVEAIAPLLFDGVEQAFVPLARVEKTIGRSATLRLRAGGLIFGQSPAQVAGDAVFRPVIRRNDRQISLKPEFSELVPWTLLQTTSRDGSLLECDILSGVRSALTGRSGRRTEKLALAAKPTHESTRLVIASKEETPRPLPGYEVLVRGVDFAAVERIFKRHCASCHGLTERGAGLRLDTYDGVLNGGDGGPVIDPGRSRTSRLMKRLVDPDPKLRMPKDAPPLSNTDIELIRTWIDQRALQESEPQLLGISDFDGAVEIQPGDKPVRIVYVKHGAQPLAKLPIMPGLEPELTINLPDDGVRLDAEAAVITMQRSFMDAVTRQQLLALQIRKHIEKRRFDDAQKLLDQLRTLKTRNDFTTQLEFRRRDFEADDTRTKSRIDLLFGDARAMFNQHLDPRLVEQLSQELTRARGGRR